MREPEERIIGSLLSGTAKEFRLFGIHLDRELFKLHRCQSLFDRMSSMVKQGKDFDIATMAYEFRGDKEITPEYLIGLIDPGVTAYNTPRSIEILNTQRFRESITEIILKNKTKTAGEVAEELQASIWKYHGNTVNNWQIKEALTRTLDQIEVRKSGEVEFRWGIHDFDRLLGGIYRKETTVIGARPSQGKSSIAMNVAYTQLKAGKKVLYIDLESGDSAMLERFLCRHTGIPIRNIHQGYLSDTQMINVTNGAAELSKMPLIINDRAAITVGEIYNQALESKADLVIVDYLNLMSSNFALKEVDHLGMISLGLHEAAKNLNVPILVLAQLNRGPENRPDHRPTLADLRGSGKIEEYADNIILLHWPYKYDDTQPPNESLAVIAKHRAGETGQVELYWDAPKLKFGSLSKMVPAIK